MKNLFKKIRAFNKWIKENPDFSEDYKPIVQPLKAFSAEEKGLSESLCYGTEWSNGEGFDFSFADKKGNEKFISLHHDEIELMLSILDEMNYFETD